MWSMGQQTSVLSEKIRFWKKTAKIHPFFYILTGGAIGAILSL